MSKQTMTPERVGKEYNAGISFNSGIDLYDCVETNENFFIGKQWEGVQSNGLPTPVFNFLKRVVLFSVANISTDNLKLWARAMSSSGERNTQTLELVAELRRRVPDCEILFVGNPGGMEATLVPRAGFRFAPYRSMGIQRRFSWNNIKYNA